MLDISIEIISILSFVAGVFFILTGSIGLIRLPDVFSRIHAAGGAAPRSISGRRSAAEQPPAAAGERRGGRAAHARQPICLHVLVRRGGPVC